MAYDIGDRFRELGEINDFYRKSRGDVVAASRYLFHETDCIMRIMHVASSIRFMCDVYIMIIVATPSFHDAALIDIYSMTFWSGACHLMRWYHNESHNCFAYCLLSFGVRGTWRQPQIK